MSRHGKLADDSARLNVVLPKPMFGRLEEAKRSLNAVSTSDAARVCIEYGLRRIESMKKKGK